VRGKAVTAVLRSAVSGDQDGGHAGPGFEASAAWKANFRTADLPSRLTPETVTGCAVPAFALEAGPGSVFETVAAPRRSFSRILAVCRRCDVGVQTRGDAYCAAGCLDLAFRSCTRF